MSMQKPILFFERLVEVSMGQKEGLGYDYKQQLVISNLMIRRLNLKIEFSVEKDVEKGYNSCELKIINMHNDTYELIAGAPDPIIMLSVGYPDNFGTIFYGDLTTMNRERQGTEYVATIKAKEGLRANRLGVMNKTYPKGTKISVVVEDCKKVMAGLGINVTGAFRMLNKESGAPDILVEDIGDKSVTAYDCAISVMAGILRKFNYKVYINNNALVIAPYKLGALNNDAFQDGSDMIRDSKGILLSPKTGLIGSPSVDKYGVVKLKAKIQPQVTLGEGIRVVSKDFDGYYTVKKIKYVGDNFTGPFDMEIEAV